MRRELRIGEGSPQTIASPSKPQGCELRLVRDMSIGETAWTLPRAVAIDFLGDLWICLNFPIVSRRDRNAVALVTKTADSYSIQVESEWTPLSKMPGFAYSRAGV